MIRNYIIFSAHRSEEHSVSENRQEEQRAAMTRYPRQVFKGARWPKKWIRTWSGRRIFGAL